MKIINILKKSNVKGLIYQTYKFGDNLITHHKNLGQKE